MRRPLSFEHPELREILTSLHAYIRPGALEGMKRYGIDTSTALGVSLPDMRTLAKQYRNRHDLALILWAANIHEARIMATLIDDPQELTLRQMEDWATDFTSWDLCDQCCNNLFRKTPHAWQCAYEWPRRREEFVKRAGFVLQATLAVHDKKRNDADFLDFLSLIIRESNDERNFVKKAVNWSLRQIGKRSAFLLERALASAESLAGSDSRSARWIGNDALREFRKRAAG